MLKKTYSIFDEQEITTPTKIFNILVVYRWVSLIPPLVVLFLAYSRLSLAAFIIALLANLLITSRSEQLNQFLQQHPALLMSDLGLVLGLVAMTGGWVTPFYLYALNPLLIAAFFFGLRRALLTTTAFSTAYILVILSVARDGAALDWLMTTSSLVGFFLISGTFGLASGLLTKLRLAQEDLWRSHLDLKVVHKLTVALQVAADIAAMQEQVLAAVTGELGFRRAIIGLVTETNQGSYLHRWQAYFKDGLQLSHQRRVPLNSTEGGLVADAILEKRICHANDGPCTADGWINEHFGMTGCRIFPMLLHEKPIGVLMVDTRDEANPDIRLPLLEAIANQTALAIGSMRLRTNHARERAIQEERDRIAQDLHDTVSQLLFGIVFTLDGSLKLLPERVDEVIPELERALKSAEEVRGEIRRSIQNIWSSTLTASRFTHDLQEYARDVCLIGDSTLEFDVRGDFVSLSPLARRSLYRIAQESLNNVAMHAAANETRVCLDIINDRAQLVVRDNGRGFETTTAVRREFEREHFGLDGIQKRAAALGGECHIFSQPGAGTSIVVDIPIAIPPPTTATAGENKLYEKNPHSNR